jgi:4-amino-4-deoxy-L-arabinose transferase-like glycosyltransferase
MMNRSYTPFLFLLAACGLLTLLYCPPVDIPVDDKEVFRYAGQVIFKGGVPYRDFFDHKPPLIFFFNFFGLLLGSWGLWLIDLFLALLATGLFFRCCLKYKLPYPWLLPLLFNLMLRDSLICDGIGMTREYTTLFQLLFFCVLLGKYRHRDFLAGLLSALVFFMQQDQVLFLLPFLIYTLLSDDLPHFIIRLLRLGAGFLTILLPMLSYFAVHHSLGYFWADAFQFNFTWYTAEKKSLPDHFRTIKQALDATNYAWPFLVAVTLGIGALFLQNKKKTLVLAALAGVALSLSAEFLGARAPDANFSYYFVPLSASLVILLFTVFAFTEDAILRERKAQLLYGFLLCCSLSYTALQHATHLGRRSETPLLRMPALKYLRQHPPADHQLYTLGNTGFIYAYNEFGILSPSPWIYHQFWKWYDRWDADRAIQQSIGDDLLRYRTRYIWVDLNELARFRNPANYKWWMDFLQTHYRPVPGADEPWSSLWEWKDN